MKFPGWKDDITKFLSTNSAINHLTVGPLDIRKIKCTAVAVEVNTEDKTSKHHSDENDAEKIDVIDDSKEDDVDANNRDDEDDCLSDLSDDLHDVYRNYCKVFHSYKSLDQQRLVVFEHQM